MLEINYIDEFEKKRYRTLDNGDAFIYNNSICLKINDYLYYDLNKNEKKYIDEQKSLDMYAEKIINNKNPEFELIENIPLFSFFLYDESLCILTGKDKICHGYNFTENKCFNMDINSHVEKVDLKINVYRKSNKNIKENFIKKIIDYFKFRR